MSRYADVTEEEHFSRRRFISVAAGGVVSLVFLLIVGICISGCSGENDQEANSVEAHSSEASVKEVVGDAPAGTAAGGSSNDIYLDVVTKGALLDMIQNQIIGCDIFISSYADIPDMRDTYTKYETRKQLLEKLESEVEALDESDDESLQLAYDEMHRILQ